MMSGNDDQIDHTLSREDAILPSAGFTASVMDAVRREACVPAPIPFPWKRALPVLVLAALAVIIVPIVAVTAIARVASAPLATTPANTTFFWTQISAWVSNPAIGWTTGSLLLAFIAVKFSMRLASR